MFINLDKWMVMLSAGELAIISFMLDFFFFHSNLGLVSNFQCLFCASWPVEGRVFAKLSHCIYYCFFHFVPTLQAQM